MKKLFTLIMVIFITFSALAQAPQKMSYQAVIRNSSDQLITNVAIGMRIGILQGSATGTAVYVETQKPTTNANGLATIEIGSGTVVRGTFAGINWAGDVYFIKTEIDPAGGTSYTITGTSQILSVPYALNASLASGLANNTVASANIVNESIVAADIQDRLRNIVFPANALNYDKASTILTQTASGITWQSDYSNAAYLMLSKPLDWDETSNVTFKLYFMALTNSSGVVVFFIRPRSFNSGETFADATSINPVSNVTIPVGSQYKVYEQIFTIPSTRFGTKSMWVISIQREGPGETYADNLNLMSIEIIYTAEQ
jgi:hypothetical protein